MKLLLNSANPSRSFNGGDYAKGYVVTSTQTGCIVTVDRCYGSEYEGEYLHSYELDGVTVEQAEVLVQANPEAFANQCNGKAVAALLQQEPSAA